MYAPQTRQGSAVTHREGSAERLPTRVRRACIAPSYAGRERRCRASPPDARTPLTLQPIASGRPNSPHPTAPTLTQYKHVKSKFTFPSLWLRGSRPEGKVYFHFWGCKKRQPHPPSYTHPSPRMGGPVGPQPALVALYSRHAGFPFRPTFVRSPAHLL